MKMPTLAGKEVSQNGLGLMRFTWPGATLTDAQSFAILKAALAAGVNVWNGADFYGTPERNSLHLMQRFFAANPEDADKVVLTIKSGIRDINNVTLDSSPAFMRQQVVTANQILAGTKKIDVFGPGRIDGKVPVEETVKELSAMVAEGEIGGIQLTEVDAETIRRAVAVAKIDMVETEINLWATQVFKNGVADICAELGIAMVAHTPLGAGILTGKFKNLEDMPVPDYYRHLPRFQPAHFSKNLELLKALEKITTTKSCTTAQLALSWIKVQSRKPGVPLIIPVSGASSTERVAENARLVDLTDEDLEEVSAILSSFTDYKE